MTSRLYDLADLYVAEKGRLYRLINRIVGSRAVAEDVAQDTFIKLSGRNLGPGDRSLLFRTAQNLAIDHLRSQRVKDAYAGDPGAAQQPKSGVALDDAFAARQELAALMSALESLPRRTQQVFLLNRLDGMTYPQIAKALGISVRTVEKDLVRALTFCRDWRKNREIG